MASAIGAVTDSAVSMAGLGFSGFRFRLIFTSPISSQASFESMSLILSVRSFSPMYYLEVFADHAEGVFLKYGLDDALWGECFDHEVVFFEFVFQDALLMEHGNEGRGDRDIVLDDIG